MAHYVKKALITIGLLLIGSTALAQLGSVPYTFTPGTTISSSQVNANFSTAYSTALNRTAGVMSGTLTTLAVLPATDALYDLGTASFRYRDSFISRNAVIGGTLAVTGAATFSSTVATGALTVTGTVTATLFSGSGASLVIPESAITDESLLARNAGNESITGLWAFTQPPGIQMNNAYLFLYDTAGSANLRRWSIAVSAGNFLITTADDAGNALLNTLYINRSGDTTISGNLAVVDVNSTGNFTSTNVSPQVIWHETGAPANQGFWDAVVDGGNWDLRLYNDLLNAYSSMLYVNGATQVISSTGAIAAGSSITATGNVVANGGTLSSISAGQPTVYLQDTTQAANSIYWGMYTGGGTFVVSPLSDALTQTGTGGFSITRTGVNATLMTIYPNVNTSGTLTTAGAITATATTITAGTYLVGTSGVKEHSRSFAMGDTQTRGFSAGNYTAVGGTWTVGSGDVVGETYRVVGDTLFFNVSIETSTIASAPTSLRIAIPGGFTAQEATSVTSTYVDMVGGGAATYIPLCQAAGSNIDCHFSNGAAFIAGTDNQALYFQIVLKVS